jgi:hypothetical protein
MKVRYGAALPRLAVAEKSAILAFVETHKFVVPVCRNMVFAQKPEIFGCYNRPDLF